MGPPTIVAPTWLEYGTARLAIRGAPVTRSGVARPSATPRSDRLVLCGLAGALDAGLTPGMVVVAQSVATEGGDPSPCDPELVDAMVAGAESLGLPVRRIHLLTARALVTGPNRQAWAQKGFQAADMETALYVDRASSLTSVRVILDSPSHSISERWLRAPTAMLRPSLWRELVWLAAHAPVYSMRAAKVVQAGLSQLGAGSHQAA